MGVGGPNWPEGGGNRFAYAANHPLSFKDPTGTTPEPQYIAFDEHTVKSKAPPPTLVNTGRGLAGAGVSQLPVDGDPQFEPADLAVEESGPANGPEYMNLEEWGAGVRQRADATGASAAKAAGGALAVGAAFGVGVAFATLALRSTLTARGYMAVSSGSTAIGAAIQKRPALAAALSAGGAVAEADAIAHGALPGTGPVRAAKGRPGVRSTSTSLIPRTSNRSSSGSRRRKRSATSRTTSSFSTVPSAASPRSPADQRG